MTNDTANRSIHRLADDQHPSRSSDPALFSADRLDTAQWLPIAVPGDVNAVLVANQRMPDPHLGDNARQCYWVSARDWWYLMKFVTPDGGDYAQADLRLDGVDGKSPAASSGISTACRAMSNMGRPRTRR